MIETILEKANKQLEKVDEMPGPNPLLYILILLFSPAWVPFWVAYLTLSWLSHRLVE